MKNSPQESEVMVVAEADQASKHVSFGLLSFMVEDLVRVELLGKREKSLEHVACFRESAGPVEVEGECLGKLGEKVLS